MDGLPGDGRRLPQSARAGASKRLPTTCWRDRASGSSWASYYAATVFSTFTPLGMPDSSGRTASGLGSFSPCRTAHSCSSWLPSDSICDDASHSGDQLVLLARVSFAGTALLGPLVLAAILSDKPPGVEIPLATVLCVLVVVASSFGFAPASIAGLRVDLLLLVTVSVVAGVSTALRR